MAELTRRYIVTTMGIEGPFDPTDPDAPFVLKPWKDPAALLALEACYRELAAELSAWIRTIRSGAAAPGSVGARNAAHLASRVAARPRPKAKAQTKPKSRKLSKNKPRKLKAKRK
jgi:hypothetical protein